jgi:hypothetical protein
MDKLKLQRMLMRGLGEDAKARKREMMRQKYADAPPAMAAQMEAEDDATEKAELPKVDMSGADVSDVDSGAEETGRAIREAAADPMEDEEMQKWMAKQRG